MGASLKREGRQLRLGDVKRPCAGGRTIDLPPAFLGLLREHRSSRVREWLVAGPAWIYGGYVFASKFRTPLDPANVRRLFRRIGEPAGIGAVVPYQLRHTAASLLLDNDATIEEVTPPRPEGRASVALLTPLCVRHDRSWPGLLASRNRLRQRRDSACACPCCPPLVQRQ